MRLPTRASRDLGVIYAAGLLRSTGVGLTGVLLGVYLSRAGFSATEIGVVVTLLAALHHDDPIAGLVRDGERITEFR